MWVTLSEAGKDVAKITPAGAVTTYDLEAVTASGIAVGPEGRIWITRNGDVISFDPADPEGTKDPTPVGEIGTSHSIVAGPDGNMWVATDGKILRIQASDPSKVTPFAVAGLAPKDIDVAGPLLVVADSAGEPSRIVTLTTDGTEVDYPIPGGSQGVAGRPDGLIGFSQQANSARAGRPDLTADRVPADRNPRWHRRPLRCRGRLRPGLLVRDVRQRRRRPPHRRRHPDVAQRLRQRILPPPDRSRTRQHAVGHARHDRQGRAHLRPRTAGRRTAAARDRGREAANPDQERPQGQGQDEGQATQGQVPLQLARRRGDVPVPPGPARQEEEGDGLEEGRASGPADRRRPIACGPGSYRFEVRAVLDGLVDTTPARRSFRIVRVRAK